MNVAHARTPFAPAEDFGSGGSAASTLSDTASTAAQKAREAAGKIKSVAAETTGKARERLGQAASAQKEAAAKRIGSYGSAIHDSARSIEQEDPNIAWFAHRVADRIESAADYLRERDLEALRSDVEDVARRHPGLFFGGMFVAGLLAGNLVKASGRKASTADGDRPGEWEGSRAGGIAPSAPLSDLPPPPATSNL